jgi:hypothetical protein
MSQIVTAQLASAHPWARTLPQARPDPGNVLSSEETLLISAERCIWLPHWKLHLLDHFGSISLYSLWDLITKFRPEVDSFKHVLMTFKDREGPILWFPRQRRQVFSDSWAAEMSHIILDDESAIESAIGYSLSSSFQSAAKCCKPGPRIMMVQPFNRLSLTVSSCRHRQRAMLYYVLQLPSLPSLLSFIFSNWTRIIFCANHQQKTIKGTNGTHPIGQTCIARKSLMRMCLPPWPGQFFHHTGCFSQLISLRYPRFGRGAFNAATGLEAPMSLVASWGRSSGQNRSSDVW